MKHAPIVRIYNKNVATIRVVLRDLADGVDVWLFASDGMRRHERFADRDGAEVFRAQIHDTIVARGYRLVWNSAAEDTASRDAA